MNISQIHHRNVHVCAFDGKLMPIPSTVEIINDSDGSLLGSFTPPFAGSETYFFGRNELISWLGDFPGSEKVSRQHIIFEATDWQYGVGELVIRDAGSKNGTMPNPIPALPSYIDGEIPPSPLIIQIAGVVSIGLRSRIAGKDGRPVIDIGHFGLHEEDPGIGFLKSGLPNDVEAATALIQNLGASLTSGFLHVEDELLNHQERNKLISYTDAHFDGSPDFKLYLTPSELENLVGVARYEYLSSKMGNNFSEIVLRRVEDHGHAINFHTDYSHKTMQIMLSEQNDYDGCDLVFVTGAGFEKPTRMPGQATIHDNSILHGVTEMKSGVRHSLFFLRNEVTF